MNIETGKGMVGLDQNIDALLTPKRIAVVGATPDLGKPGGRFLSFLGKYGFPGTIYPVNPKYSDQTGSGYYPDLASLPEVPDSIALIVPGRAVPAYLASAAEIGVKAAMVLSSGFAESGEEGEALQAEIVEIARSGGIALLGPNCLGIADADHDFVASFSNAFEGDQSIRGGNTAFVSQSGAMGATIFVEAQKEGVGVSRFVSTGNEAGLKFSDFVDHLIGDDSIATVLGYIEGLSDGAAFVRSATALREADKTLVALKVGTSDAGATAAQSHTGAIVSGKTIYEAAFRRAGVLAAEDTAHLIELASALPEKYPVRGGRVGIVSSSGGAAVMMADACSAADLRVPAFAPETMAELSQILPPFAGYTNPVDYGPVYSDPDKIEASMHAMASDPNIDVILFFLALSETMKGQVEPRIARVQERSGKPVVAVWMTGPDDAVDSLRSHGITAFQTIQSAVRVIQQLVCRATWCGPVAPPERNEVRRKETRLALGKAIDAGCAQLSEMQTKSLLAPYGLTVTRDVAVDSAVGAEEVVRTIGVPAVIKAHAADLVHKSDAGAVRLNVSVDDAVAAYEAVVGGASKYLGRKVREAIVQPMVAPGMEILMGVTNDLQFGPAITVGFGGTMTEVLADVSTELVPLDRPTALAMLDRLAGARLLDEFRGRAALDREGLADALVSLSAFAEDAAPMLAELDLNPVILHPVKQGYVVVDAVAVLKTKGV